MFSTQITPGSFGGVTRSVKNLNMWHVAAYNIISFENEKEFGGINYEMDHIASELGSRIREVTATKSVAQKSSIASMVKIHRIVTLLMKGLLHLRATDTTCFTK